MSISKKVTARPVLILIIFALIAIMGLYSMTNLTIDLFPSINFPIILVTASYDDADPESVESAVTKVLESGLVNVSGLKKMTSTSSEENCTIELEFEYGVNLDAATNNIRDKIDSVKYMLPDKVKSPTIMKFDSDSEPIIKIALKGNRTPEDLREIAKDYIEPRIKQVDGVAQAMTSGGRTEIIRVELSQNRLDAYDLTINEISSSLASQNLQIGGGNIYEGMRQYTVRTTGEFKDVNEIAQTVVGIKDGYGVKLMDLGNVIDGYEDENSMVYINGFPGIYVSIQKQTGSNSVKVADAVYEKIEDIKKTLPGDISIEIISDSTTEIRDTIKNLVESAFQGALLAMAILFLFLRSIKSTLIIGISIPFSIITTLLFMNLFGITLNMMTMTGLILGIGMIVDASIVVIENTFQYRERGARSKIAATLGTGEMMFSIVASNLTTVCVFIPIIFFKNRLDFIGQLFQGMIFTIIIALLSSLLVAIFLVPVLTSHYLKLVTRREKPLKNPILLILDNFLERSLVIVTKIYRFILTKALNHRIITTLIVIGALLISIIYTKNMNISLMPEFSNSSVTLNVTLPLGTRYIETKEIMFQLEEIARSEIKGYKTIITNVNTGGFLAQENAVYKGSLFIQLEDEKKRIESADVIKNKLREHFSEFPNAEFVFSQGMEEGMAGRDIDIVIKTDNLTFGLKTANELKNIVKEKITDITELEINTINGLPQVEVVIDRERAYSFGVNINDAAREINASIAGVTATVFRKDGKEYNVVLIYQDSDRTKIPDLEKIYVMGKSGRIALSNFATLEKGYGPVSIKRENQGRTIHLTANIISNEKPNVVEQKIKKVMEESIILPDGITIYFDGSWQKMIKQMLVFILIITMALLLVFGVMAGQYESFKDPFINLFTIPLMIIGVVAIYAFTNQAISTFTLVGVVMLAGIVVNNGIILVDYTNLLVGRGTPVYKACIEAGCSRLRPVLMTTLTTILGMVPMAFSKSESSQMIQPIGLTVIGGLTSSTLITLFFIPVIYSFFNEKRSKSKKDIEKKEDKEVQICTELK